MESIAQALRRNAAARPDKPAVVSGESGFRYAELWAHACACAQWLSIRGVRHGDRVVIRAASNDLWGVVAYFGVHLAGAIAVPLDSKAQESNVNPVVARVEPALTLEGTALDELRRFALQPGHDLGGLEDALPPVHLEDIADILFTSGSTGQQKGVMLTHANIAASTQNIISFIGNDASDREVCTVPLNHSFGLGRLRCNMVAGGTLILVPGLRFPALVFKALATHRATGLSCVPSGLAVLLRSAGERLGARAGSLRYMEMGSERMDAAAKRELMELLPATRICMHYGLTEASRSAFTEFHRDASRLDSVGKASPNVTIAICDEAGTALPPGESGRIRVRAATVMKSYWRDPERTRSVLDEQGWFDTGDLGYLDADGYLYLQGRSDDVINVGGRKVYPATVEEAALKYPGVTEAACVAAPDPEGLVAEVPVLYVVADGSAPLDSAGLRRFLETVVERYAVPRQVRCVDALPKTASGKIQRSVLKAQAFRDPSAR